jgi:glutathione S-transferase
MPREMPGNRASEFRALLFRSENALIEKIDNHLTSVMIELFTAATPNGWKIAITLEELALPYTVRALKLSAGEQKQDWYTALNPNGKIPTIVDHAADDFVVFESGAIQLYLAERSGRLLGATAQQRSQVVQWLMFQMGGIGPMMGQAAVFLRYAPEKIPFAIERYQREVRRLFEVLDRRLQAAEFLAGEYSIADIANWCWVHTHEFVGVNIDGLEHLRRWIRQIADRPAVQRGKAVPESVDLAQLDERALAERRKLLS